MASLPCRVPGNDGCMSLPVLHGRLIGRPVQRHARAPFFLSQGVPAEAHAPLRSAERLSNPMRGARKSPLTS